MQDINTSLTFFSCKNSFPWFCHLHAQWLCKIMSNQHNPQSYKICVTIIIIKIIITTVFLYCIVCFFVYCVLYCIMYCIVSCGVVLYCIIIIINNSNNNIKK